jgi:outer membrane protein assembly factor BamB
VADRYVRKGRAAEFRLLFSDVFRDKEQDALSLTITQAGGAALPSWLTASIDSRTGEIVWQETVPWNGDLNACHHVFAEEEDTGYSYDEPGTARDADLPGISFWTSLIHVEACGVSATFLPDGTKLLGDEPVLGGAALLSSGLILVVDHGYESGEYSTTLRTVAGQEILTTDGDVMSALTTDGTPSDLVLVGNAQGAGVRAHRQDGTHVWEAEEILGRLTARVGDTGIFHGAAEGIAGIDLRTGRQLWERGEAVDGSIGLDGMITAFTDGRSVMLAGTEEPNIYATEGTPSEDAAPARLVAIDAGTGRTRWTLEHDDHTWFAVAGRLMSVTDDGALVGYR